MRLKYDFSFQQYDDKYMAIADYNEGEENLKLIWVNEVGKEILELLQDETTADEVILVLKDRYQSEGDEVDRSVKDFIKKIDDEGFLLMNSNQ